WGPGGNFAGHNCKTSMESSDASGTVDGASALPNQNREERSDVRDGLDLSHGPWWCRGIPSLRNASSPLYGPTRHCCGALLSGTRGTFSPSAPLRNNSAGLSHPRAHVVRTDHEATKSPAS